MKRQLMERRLHFTMLIAGSILLAIVAQSATADLLDDSCKAISSIKVANKKQVNYSPEEEKSDANVSNKSGILHSFIDASDIEKMRENRSFNCTSSARVNVESICEPGKLYAFYFYHKDNSIDSQDVLSFSIPSGTFRADWINPSNGKIIYSEYFTVKKERHKLTTPKYSAEMALKIIRIL